MPANSSLPILVTLLISLFPVAVYCLILATINRRSEPLLVRGALDFGCVLFAVSGIVLWAGPAMLITLYQRTVTDEPGRSFEEVWWQWRLIWIAYYGVVLAGGFLLLWLRRPTTAIYNVQTERVAGALTLALQRLGYEFVQNAQQQFLIAPAKSLASTAVPAAMVVAALPPPALAPPLEGGDGGAADAMPPYSAAVEIEVFGSMAHATLHWYETSPRSRRAIEDELRTCLAGAGAVDNPAALWQTGISVLLLGAIILSIILYFLAALLPRRW